MAHIYPGFDYISLVFIKNLLNNKSKHKKKNVTICIVLSGASHSYLYIYIYIFILRNLFISTIIICDLINKYYY